MKNILKITVLVLVLVCTAMSADAKKKKNPDGKAELVFVTDTYDFGEIPENGGSVTHEFAFTNEGDAPLVIFDAFAECGCTRPDYPKKAIEPGKKGKISVTYNPKGRPGSFTKVVTVKCNGKKGKLHLKIKGVVK